MKVSPNPHMDAFIKYLAITALVDAAKEVVLGSDPYYGYVSRDDLEKLEQAIEAVEALGYKNPFS